MMLMIRMDFGFFSPSAGENRWLREELVYPGTNIYYAIMIEDVALRLAWAAGLGLSKVIIVHQLNYSLSIYWSSSCPEMTLSSRDRWLICHTGSDYTLE